MDNTRNYPSCCLSAMCGRTECSGCRSAPVLADFKAWVKNTDATVADSIWSPTIYVAKRTERKFDKLRRDMDLASGEADLARAVVDTWSPETS